MVCGCERKLVGFHPDGRAWCDRCYVSARRNAADVAAIERVAAVATAVTGLDEHLIRAVIADVLGPTRTLRRVDRHLAQHPDVLTAGPVSAHRPTWRFLNALNTAGACLAVTHPWCVACGRRMQPAMHHGEGWLCASCANLNRACRCGSCGNERLVNKRRADGTNWCLACSNDERRHERLAPINTALVDLVRRIDPDIDPVVVVAAAEATARAIPARTRLVAQLTSNGWPQRARAANKLTTRFADAVHAGGGRVPLPIRSYNHPIGPRPDYHCPNCGQPTPQRNRSHCKACHVAVPRPRGTCVRCQRVGVPFDADGVCGPCRRWEHHHCDTCPQRRPLVVDETGRRCHRCRLHEETTALAGNDPPDWLLNVITALNASKTAFSTREWLADSPGGRLLHAIVAGRVPLTHDDLDRHTGRSVAHLRGMLIAAGALEPDNRWFERLEQHIVAATSTVSDTTDRHTINSWMRWHALPRIRRRADRGRSVAHSAGNLRRQLREIIEFTTGVHDVGRSLGECRQTDIDTWFAQPGTAARDVRPFLVWAIERRHLPGELEFPPTGARSPRNAVEYEHRWDLARRLINDSTIRPDDRVAGALVVLYAQPLTRIAGLTTDAVTTGPEGTAIRFDRFTIDLPEPFATLAQQLPIRRQAGAANLLPTNWLFPSRRPDRPIGADTLGQRLRRIGINARECRIAALNQLAGEIPPAVLANAIGINARTATQAVTINGGNWTRYVAN